MFIGTYECRLDAKGRFTVPKRYRELLAQGAEEDRALVFAAADTLRCYAQREYRRIPAAPSDAAARYSGSGLVVIPAALRALYGLSPGQTIALLGCGAYFMISGG